MKWTNENCEKYYNKMYQVITCFLTNYINVMFYNDINGWTNLTMSLLINGWFLVVVTTSVYQKPLEFMNIPLRLNNTLQHRNVEKCTNSLWYYVCTVEAYLLCMLNNNFIYKILTSI